MKNPINVISKSAVNSGLFNTNLPTTLHGMGDSALQWSGSSFEDFKKALSEVYNAEKQICKSYSLKKYESEMIKHFKDRFLVNADITREDVTYFHEQLLETPLSVFTVYRDIWGVKLANDFTNLQLGPFTIQHFNSHQTELEKGIKNHPNVLWRNSKKEYLISTTSSARDHLKAISDADRRFQLFETIIAFVIGFKSTNHEISVIHKQINDLNRVYVKDDFNRYYDNMLGAKTVLPWTIDSKYFSDTRRGYNKIWELLEKTNKSEFERKLLRSIAWIGESIIDDSLHSSFLRLAIGLEILFSSSDKEIINPSILHRLCESVALILGNGYTESTSIEKELKKLYGIRSAIAHHGSDRVSAVDYGNLLQYSREVITKLITCEDYADIKNNNDLAESLKKKKYR